MNNSGPKTEPWGTPYITFSEVEFVSFILVYWFLSTKNDLNQSLALLLNPLYHKQINLDHKLS